VDIPRITIASDSSLLLTVGESASEAVQNRVAALTKALLHLRDPRIRNIHPAYTSILIDFNPLRTSHEEIAALIRTLQHEPATSIAPVPRTVEIPVCYGHEFGLDLDDVAKETGLSAEEVIRRHSAATYNVSFFGFAPGFAYLAGLSPSLHVTRLPSPRRLVQAGSVAIAAEQTGVYSVDSPGGWRLLGKTPLRMFDPHANLPTPLEVGDRVRFVPITREEFERQTSRPSP
jgi:KipI family sensor histidine kinase inhibitor